ncbi:hypothetical protein ACHAPO_006236 [Fusarium lateritium]
MSTCQSCYDYDDKRARRLLLTVASYSATSVDTDSASYTTSGATTDAKTDTASDATTDVSVFNTRSATTAAAYATSDVMTDVSSLATKSATTEANTETIGDATTNVSGASTYTISESETDTTTGPAAPLLPSQPITQNDALIASFEATRTYAVADVEEFTYAKTIFTDATTVYSVEATNTVGTIATTTLTTSTTVTNGVTSTIITTLSTDDGDSEYEPGTNPWYASYKSKYDWDRIWLDNAHGKVLQTKQLYNNINFILWQDVQSCKGVTFSCDYQFWIDKYYYLKGDKKPGKGKNDNSDSAYYWWTTYVWTFWNDNPSTIG